MFSSGSVIVEVTDEKQSGMVAFNFSIGRVDLIVNGKSLDATNIVKRIVEILQRRGYQLTDAA